MSPQCPPCALELQVRAQARDAALMRARQQELSSEQSDMRRRIEVAEHYQEQHAINLDRLADSAQRHELAAQRTEVVLARLEGLIEGMGDRPSVVVQVPDSRSSTAPTVSLGKGEWHLRLKGKAAILAAFGAILVALAWMLLRGVK